jgi:streptomycin 6-kinase
MAAPFPSPLIDNAVALASTLAHADGSQVVVNRDAHLGNILASEREGWLLIDPKPLVGDGSFDAGYLLLDRLGQASTSTATDRLVGQLASGWMSTKGASAVGPSCARWKMRCGR